MTVLHVVFSVGSAEYVLPADQVTQLESYSGATPVPGAAEHVVGLVQVRGQVIPAIDLRVRFGLEPQLPSLDTRIVVVERGTRRVALVADVAREVLSVSPEQFQPPPALVAEQAAGFVRAVAQIGNRLVFLMDFDKVVGEEQLDGG
jgi:purine-binding chemotaxis protein CheW